MILEWFTPFSRRMAMFFGGAWLIATVLLEKRRARKLRLLSEVEA